MQIARAVFNAIQMASGFVCLRGQLFPDSEKLAHLSKNIFVTRASIAWEIKVEGSVKSIASLTRIVQQAVRVPYT